MFGIAILDVIIGMIFIFLLLSLVCSAINEIIEAYMNKRADYLFQGIKDLLDDKDGNGLAGELYAHPLIASLLQNKYGGKPLRPSYIPARNFSLALMDIVSAAGDIKKSGSASATPPKALPAPLVISNVPVTAEALAPAPASTEGTENLRSAVALMENPYIKRALLPLIDAAGKDAAKARENIENWFNSGMDKVSGWYKRRAQIILLLLGFLIALFLNADTITISNKLWHDKPLRDSLVASAQEAVKNNPAGSNDSTPQPAAQEIIDDCGKKEDKKGVCSNSCLKNTNSPECRLNESLQRIEDLNLPIGWSGSNLLTLPPAGHNAEWILAWLKKLLGLLITAFAVSLGAPFWFDLLNKFVVVRSTVKPREKSHEEESKE
ncbi:MAG TPA: hypothetical protein VGC76_09780 [Pyrinomonadaceae bacterium]|jgi:hypothetical protein